MSVKAIIFTANRVIRRLTTDEPPHVLSDETAIVVPDGTDIGPSGETIWWRLDLANLKIPATQAQADAAGIDEAARNARKLQARIDLKASIDPILADLLVPASLKVFFTAYQKLLK